MTKPSREVPMRSVRSVLLLALVVGGCSSDTLGPKTITGRWVQDFTVAGNFMGGVLSDRFGTRKPMIICLTLLVCALGGIEFTSSSLIAAGVNMIASNPPTGEPPEDEAL